MNNNFLLLPFNFLTNTYNIKKFFENLSTFLSWQYKFIIKEICKLKSKLNSRRKCVEWLKRIEEKGFSEKEKDRREKSKQVLLN